MGIVAERIKIARINLNLNQKELALKADITEASLSRYESGQREPKASVLVKLSNALNVSTDYLLGLTNIKDRFFSNEVSDLKNIEDILSITEKLMQKDCLKLGGVDASQESKTNILKSMKMGLLLSLYEQEK